VNDTVNVKTIHSSLCYNEVVVFTVKMEAHSLNAYYQLIRIAHKTKLDNGNCILTVWRDGNKLAVSPVSLTNDDQTIKYCNMVQDLCQEYEILEYVHIEPLGWSPGESDLTQWIHESFEGEGFCIQSTEEGVKISTSPIEYTIIKDT
jgi:hypothetical protein